MYIQMCVCMYIYIYIHTSYTYACTCIELCVCIYTYACMHAYTCIYVYNIYIYIYIYGLCTYKLLYVYAVYTLRTCIHIHIYIYVCVYIYIYVRRALEHQDKDRFDILGHRLLPGGKCIQSICPKAAAPAGSWYQRHKTKSCSRCSPLSCAKCSQSPAKMPGNCDALIIRLTCFCSFGRTTATMPCVPGSGNFVEHPHL